MVEDEVVPIEEGAKAYRERQLLENNPYTADDWRFREWELGWTQSEESDGNSFDWAAGVFKNKEGKQ